MSKRKKAFLIVMFLIFDFFLVVVFLTVREATMLNQLNKEVRSLESLDFTADRYNTKFKTSGNYRKVESLIKEYMDNYAVLLQDTLKEIQDEKLTKILSYDNYQKDGPEFRESLEYLTESKKEINDNLDKLITLSEEDTFVNYVDGKINDPYYIELYKKLVSNSKIQKKFNDNKEILYETKIKINKIYDTSDKVLKFLVKNKNSWKLENKEIKFKTQALYDQYKKMIDEINKK